MISRKIKLLGILHFYKYPIFLMGCKGDVWQKIRMDASRYLRVDINKLSKFDVFSYMMLNKNLASIYLFRIRPQKIFSLFCSFIFSHNRCIEIICHPSRVGGGLIIYHNIGAVLRAKSIGINATISQGVTVGAGGDWNDTRKDNIPTIGDNVMIASNAVVIGEITIGNNAIVGAGAIITKSIPNGAVVVGNPQKIIRQQ